jgi:hypothetical protein
VDEGEGANSARLITSFWARRSSVNNVESSTIQMTYQSPDEQKSISLSIRQLGQASRMVFKATNLQQ